MLARITFLFVNADVSCPINSNGQDVASGCLCDAGYEGGIMKTASGNYDDIPYYTGSCDGTHFKLMTFNIIVIDVQPFHVHLVHWDSTFR